MRLTNDPVGVLKIQNNSILCPAGFVVRVKIAGRAEPIIGRVVAQSSKNEFTQGGWKFGSSIVLEEPNGDQTEVDLLDVESATPAII